PLDQRRHLVPELAPPRAFRLGQTGLVAYTGQVLVALPLPELPCDFGALGRFVARRGLREARQVGPKPFEGLGAPAGLLPLVGRLLPPTATGQGGGLGGPEPAAGLDLVRQARLDPERLGIQPRRDRVLLLVLEAEVCEFGQFRGGQSESAA